MSNTCRMHHEQPNALLIRITERVKAHTEFCASAAQGNTIKQTASKNQSLVSPDSQSYRACRDLNEWSAPFKTPQISEQRPIICVLLLRKL